MPQFKSFYVPENASVNMTIDLTEYLQLIQQHQAFETARDADNDDPNPYTRTLRTHKRLLLTPLEGFEGAAFWKSLLRLLRQTLPAPTTPLSTYLENPFASQDTPLIFECVQTQFVEIMKNSIDAFIRRHRNRPMDSKQDYELTIQIKTWEHNGFIHLTFQDNGIGFSPEHLATQAQFKAACCDHKDRSAEAVPTDPTQMGGNGRALRIIRDYLLAGSLRTNENTDYRIATVQPGDSDMHFSNHPITQGAMVHLSSRVLKTIPMTLPTPDTTELTAILQDASPPRTHATGNSAGLSSTLFSPVTNQRTPLTIDISDISFSPV